MEIPMHTDKKEISRKICGLFYGVNRKFFLLDDSPDTKKKGYILKRTYPLLYNLLVCLHLKAIILHRLHPILTGFGKNTLKRIHNLFLHNLKN